MAAAHVVSFDIIGAVVPEDVYPDQLAEMHSAAAVAIGFKPYAVACMVTAPGSVLWMLMGGCLDDLHRLEDWLGENAPVATRHSVMQVPGR